MTADQQTAPQPELSAAARQILEQAGVRPQARGQEPGQAGEPQTPQSLTIKVGGVDKTVSIDDLTKAYLDSGNLAATKQALDQQFAKLGDINALQQLQTAIEGMPAPKRQRLFDLIQGQDDAEDEGETDEDDDEIGAANRRTLDRLTNGKKERAPGRDPRIDQLWEAVTALVERESQRVETDRQATARQRVQELMPSYPLFKAGTAQFDPVAAGMAEETILTMLTANPQADVAQTVQRVAQRFQQLTDTRNAKVLEESGIRPPNPVQLPPPPRGGFTANQMKSGELRKLAAQAIDRLK